MSHNKKPLHMKRGWALAIAGIIIALFCGLAVLVARAPSEAPHHGTASSHIVKTVKPHHYRVRVAAADGRDRALAKRLLSDEDTLLGWKTGVPGYPTLSDIALMGSSLSNPNDAYGKAWTAWHGYALKIAQKRAATKKQEKANERQLTIRWEDFENIVWMQANQNLYGKWEAMWTAGKPLTDHIRQSKGYPKPCVELASIPLGSSGLTKQDFHSLVRKYNMYPKLSQQCGRQMTPQQSASVPQGDDPAFGE